MRRFRANRRALAEIVGTLMLVLIVVVAVTAFSLFVAGYQAQLQAEQAQAHQRSLEDIRILSVSTVLNNTTNNASYSKMSFVAGSLDVNNMMVNELLVNGQFINYYTVTPLGTGSTLRVCPLCNIADYPGTVKLFNLTSLEQVTVNVNLTLQNSTTDPTGGFLSPYTLGTSGPTDYIAISLFTTYDNDFARTYSAPTAIALTEPSEIFSNGNDTPVVVFDGSESLVPANDTIVSWSWTITNQTHNFSLNLTGEKALVLQSDFAKGVSFTVTLTVISSAGLAGTSKIVYVAD